MTNPAIRRPYGNGARAEQLPGAIRPVLCIYCRTDKFVYWPPACRWPSADCPGCQRRIAEPAATLLAGTAGTTRSLSQASVIGRLGGFPGSERPGYWRDSRHGSRPASAARDPGGASASPDAMCFPGAVLVALSVAFLVAVASILAPPSSQGISPASTPAGIQGTVGYLSC